MSGGDEVVGYDLGDGLDERHLEVGGGLITVFGLLGQTPHDDGLDLGREVESGAAWEKGGGEAWVWS